MMEDSPPHMFHRVTLRSVYKDPSSTLVTDVPSPFPSLPVLFFPFQKRLEGFKIKGGVKLSVLYGMDSKSHTHPSHSQTSRLLTSSLVSKYTWCQYEKESQITTPRCTQTQLIVIRCGPDDKGRCPRTQPRTSRPLTCQRDFCSDQSFSGLT